MRKSLLFFWALVPIVAQALDYSSFPEARLQHDYPLYGEKLPDTYGDSPRVGLYAGGGTWERGKHDLKRYLQAHNVAYRTFTASDLTNGGLQSSGVGLLIMPGGESWTYLSDLGATGAKAVTGFVSHGGGYIGICAGAFYATSKREGGPVTGDYGIGLLDGTAYDGTSLGTSPFIEGMMTWFVDTTNPLMAGLGAKYNMYLLGGPAFHYTDAEARAKSIQVLGRFEQINDPAMIAFNYGQGRVFLSAPHLEVEEDPRSVFGATPTIDPTWPILDRVVHYVLKDTATIE